MPCHILGACRRIAPFVLIVSSASIAFADALSRKTDVDFFREVPSRNLKGFASRSDGRLVAGPTLTELNGEPFADILWSLAPGADASHWFVGTGPEGRIFEATLDLAAAKYTVREIIR